jgi:hypothetical protein
MYVNGVELTDFAARTNPSQNADYNVNNTVSHEVGRNNVAGGYNFNGYLADVHFIDGQALAPTDFGETDDNGVWQPKKFDSFNNPNNGTTWSNNIVAVASGFQSGYGADKMFDGITSNYGQGNSGTNPSTLIFTPPSPITFTDKVEIWHVAGDSSISAGINSGYKSAITNGSWQTVASGGGTLTTLVI